jgi:hypothetical protein
MDKIDLFGAKYLPGFAPSLSRLLVAELKRGPGTVQWVEQTMKYVDWVRDEYAHQDYSLIKAFLVTHSFSQEVIHYCQEAAERRFTVGRRPPESHEWRDLTLVEYRFDPQASRLRFRVVAGPNSDAGGGMANPDIKSDSI